MTCMTTKQKFEVESPNVVVLKNGRFAFKERCPWDGKDGKVLYAWKFCSRKCYEDSLKSADEKDGTEAKAFSETQ